VGEVIGWDHSFADNGLGFETLVLAQFEVND
jgi:hypothetical protein